ncbi:hypothetical protein [Roseitranquillus sediminis]|uniref:hypothetical protein n=1 Tax=Roseitranquillus sediminis TaxID=2809051 RepID=UPI001D0C43CB|nr:hypothetical protein [Roseitranquillus sediminis]
MPNKAAVTAAIGDFFCMSDPDVRVDLRNGIRAGGERSLEGRRRDAAELPQLRLVSQRERER